MALSKLAIGLIAAGVSVVAVSGTVAAVVVSRQNSSQVISSDKEEETSKPNNPSNSDKDGILSDDSNVNESELIKTSLEAINKDAFVVNGIDNKEHNLSNYYAFNIKPSDLKIKEESKIDKSFNVEILFNNEKAINTIDSLNDGVLNLKINLKANNQIKATKEIKLTSFKKADENLKKILDSLELTPQKTNPKYSLTLTPKSGSETKFVSLEDLNKKETKSDSNTTPNGLTTWLGESSLESVKTQGVKLIGEVKLSTIETIKNKSYFILTSAKENQYLKLVKDDKEVALGQIRTTNLLASDITLVPKNFDQTKTEEFVNKLKTQSGEGKEFNKTNQNSNLKRDLSINVPKSTGSNDQTSQVFIKPYTVKLEEKETVDLSFDLEISFGTENTITTFSTKNEEQIKLLAAAGFNFHIYNKPLIKTGLDIDKTALLDESIKLEKYFKNQNYKTPTDKPTMSTDGTSTDGFIISNPINDQLMNNLKITVKKADLNKNFVVFSDYSYKSSSTVNGLENKVLFTPSISLIHIQATKQVGDS